MLPLVVDRSKRSPPSAPLATTGNSTATERGRAQPRAREVELDVAYRILSHTEAERLLNKLTAIPRATLAERLLRARCRRTLEMFEPAWSEFEALEAKLPRGPLRARARIELMTLSYYLDRPVDEASLSAAIQQESGDAPGMIAEMHLACSLRATARNDLHAATRELHFALDALRALPPSEGRSRLSVRLDRHAAHVFAQAGMHREASAAATAALTRSSELGDIWEIAWSTYTQGFVGWCRGDPHEAADRYRSALQMLEANSSSLPRWIAYSLGRTEAELGLLEQAEQHIAMSSYRLPWDLAYLALLRADLGLGRRILQPHLERADPFVIVVAGIIESVAGATSAGVELLARARLAFAAGGLMQFAFGTDLHLAFAQELRRRGSGRTHALQAVRELVRRGASGFPWPHRRLVEWLGGVTSQDHRLSGFGRLQADGSHALDRDLSLLWDAGLTAREREVVIRLSERWKTGQREPRQQFARDLGIAPTTLRVHLNRIRSKLSVSATRGDQALMDALERLARSSSAPP